MYRGIKQLTPVGPSGEVIMEYSIYDAIRTGFKKVIFIIRKDIEKDFKEIIGNRVSKYIDIEYVFQDINKLPQGYKKPQERTKPWGTGHAILSCADKINQPFAVINADDYYGIEGFKKINEFLNNPIKSDKKYNYCMAGFILKNTLSDFGSVTRGVCEVNSQNELIKITETYDIEKEENKAFFIDNGNKKYIDINSKVSMNMWGFTPNIISELEKRFKEFLDNIEENNLKAEYLLPKVIDDLLKEGSAKVTVLETHDKWFGVTYQEDKEFVINSFKNLVNEGKYPKKLFD